MIRSMTGYGRQEGTWSGGTVVVELRAVNHRHSEIMLRLPKPLASLEDRLKAMIHKRCPRGRIDVGISLPGTHTTQKILRIDQPLVREYLRAIAQLKHELKLAGTIDISLVAGFRDFIRISEEPAPADPRLNHTVTRLFGQALANLEAMRKREGLALEKDILTRLKAIGRASSKVSKQAPQVVESYFQRMKARVEAFVGDGGLDLSRLSHEVALFADRCDMTEELTRLGSHIVQFHGVLKQSGSVGRTLDFLLQEIGREVNTIGSKANDSAMSIEVVSMKGELEKIREQVQNIE